MRLPRGKFARGENARGHGVRGGPVRGIDPLVQKYLRILDTDPEIVLPMEGTRLTRWDGTPIYYADPAGSEAAHDVGDPVGGQLDLVSGEIKATQTTDAERPVLGGSGLSYTTAVQRIDATNRADWNHFHQTATGTISAGVALTDDSNEIIASNGFAGGDTGFLFRVFNGEVQFGITVSGFTIAATTGAPTLTGGNHDLGAVVSPSEVAFYVDGSHIATVTWSPATAAGDSTRLTSIGNWTNGTASTQLNGDISHVLADTSAYTSDQMAIIAGDA